MNVKYCGIIVDYGGFNVRVYPHAWMNVPMNIYQSNELFCIVMQQTNYPRTYVLSKQQNFDNHRTLAATNNNDSTVVVPR